MSPRLLSPSFTMLLLIFISISTTSSSFENLSTDSECGQVNSRNTRIVGGRRAYEGQFPWIVSLRKQNGSMSSSVFLHYCGGVLVTSSHVVTAAHCVNSRPEEVWRVVAGELHTKEEDSNEQERKVLSIIKHPDYSFPNFHDDLAIMTLDSPVKWNAVTSPICLPKDDTDFLKKTAIVAGWGYKSEPENKALDKLWAQLGLEPFEKKKSAKPTEQMNYVSIPVLDNQVCSDWFKDVFNDDLYKLKDKQMCAGEEKGGKDACQGDSGGPLSVLVEGRNILAGVVAAGIGCGRPRLPGIYTRVSKYNNWIKEKIQL